MKSLLKPTYLVPVTLTLFLVGVFMACAFRPLGRKQERDRMAMRTHESDARQDSANLQIAPRKNVQFQPSAPDKLGKAMNDASLSNLITNYRVAAARGDDVTQRAMLAGLRQHPTRSRELLEAELIGADPTTADAIQKAIAELR